MPSETVEHHPESYYNYYPHIWTHELSIPFPGSACSEAGALAHHLIERWDARCCVTLVLGATIGGATIAV